MRYFEQERYNWIVEIAQIYGFVNRDHIMRKFGVTSAVASKDLSNVQRDFPHTLRYNTSSKRYEWVAD